ncbi:dienelactone hydrolase-like protein [Aureococcus anophagefferens]|nr:dienelactone hydrolase-like protein [Aureococcus anophagefferens]
MLPEWWRGWLFGLLTAALLMDVAALAETLLFGDAAGPPAIAGRRPRRGHGGGPAARARRRLGRAAARQLRDPRCCSIAPPPRDGAPGLEPVDGSKCACLGWCLGGRAAAALAAASPEGLKAAVSFHGAFDAVAEPRRWRKDAPSCALLILSGSDDPFVPDLDGAVAALAAAGVPYETHVYGGAKHGFTNPAQALNDNAAFAYDDKAATGAWALAEGALVAALGQGVHTMIFAYHVCNVSEKTAPPVVEAGAENAPPASAVAPAAAGSAAPAASEAAPIALGDANTRLDRGEHGALDRRGGYGALDRGARVRRRRGGAARAAQALNKYGRVDDELARRLVELGCELRVGVALTASRLDAGLCVNYDLMARLTIKSVNVAELMLGLFGLRGNRPEAGAGRDQKLHDLLKKKLCELVEHQKHSANEAELLRTAVCKIPCKLAESNRLGDAGLVGADDQSLLSSVGLALSRPLAVRGRVLDPPIVAFKDRVRRDADGRPQTWYVKASTHVRNGEALPPQNNAYEFFDVKNTDADVQRWLVLDVTGHFLPRQAIAEFFDLVGRSLCDRGLKYWPEWDYHMINPRDIENFGGGAFCQNVSSFVSMVAAKTEFCDEFIERHAPVEPGADIASALTRPFGEIVYGFLELFEKSADQMMAVRLIQEAQPSAWFYGTRESLAHFTNPTALVAIYKGRLEGYADPPWSRADGAAPIASLDRGSRAKFDGASQIRHAERCFDFKIIVLRGGFGASENLEVEPPYLEDALGKLGLQRLQNAGMPDDELTRINDVPGYFFY